MRRIPSNNECFIVTTINLHSELHDGVDDVTVVVFKSSDSLASSAARLGDDKLDILRIDASLLLLRRKGDTSENPTEYFKKECRNFKEN